MVWRHVLMLRRDVSMHLTEEPRNRNAKLDTLFINSSPAKKCSTFIRQEKFGDIGNKR